MITILEQMPPSRIDTQRLKAQETSLFQRFQEALNALSTAEVIADDDLKQEAEDNYSDLYKVIQARGYDTAANQAKAEAKRLSDLRDTKRSKQNRADKLYRQIDAIEKTKTSIMQQITKIEAEIKELERKLPDEPTERKKRKRGF